MEKLPAKIEKMKLLIVSDKCTRNYLKLIDSLASALIEMDVEVVLLVGEKYEGKLGQKIEVLSPRDFCYLSKSHDEHRFLEAFRIARDKKIGLIYFYEITDPQRLFLALEADPEPKSFRISLWLNGVLSPYFRRPIYKHFLEKLVWSDLVSSILLSSNYPRVSELVCKEKTFLDADKMNFVHNPIIDDFSKVVEDKKMARQALDIRQNCIVFLYFGAYFLSKGADILLSVAEKMAHSPDVQFIFAGDTKLTSFEFARDYDSALNIRFDDRFVDEETVKRYLIASDLVVLPYRRYYEHNSSAVLVQSCLAKRPVLVPDISPYKEVVTDYNLGMTFECENQEALEKELKSFLKAAGFSRNWGFDRYLSGFESWHDIAKLIVNPARRIEC